MNKIRLFMSTITTYKHFILYYHIGVAICDKYHITIEDMIGKIEAHLINNSIDILTLEKIGKFEQEVHRESSKVNITIYCLFL